MEMVGWLVAALLLVPLTCVAYAAVATLVDFIRRDPW